MKRFWGCRPEKKRIRQLMLGFLPTNKMHWEHLALAIFFLLSLSSQWTFSPFSCLSSSVLLFPTRFLSCRVSGHKKIQFLMVTEYQLQTYNQHEVLCLIQYTSTKKCNNSLLGRKLNTQNNKIVILSLPASSFTNNIILWHASAWIRTQKPAKSYLDSLSICLFCAATLG